MYRRLLQVIAREASLPVDQFGADHFVLSAREIGELRTKTYIEQWQTASENGWFHVKLADHSLILFQEGGAPSYSYLQCPLLLPTFAEFLRGVGEENTPGVRREYRAEYQKLIDSASARAHLTPIRFDYDPNGYRAGVHPVAHIHIGLENQVRIAVNKMGPVSFFLFVIRQAYPDAWARLIDRPNRDALTGGIRGPDRLIEAQWWGVLDQVELYLS